MPDDQTNAAPPRRSPLASVWKPGDHGRIGPDGPGVEMRYLSGLSLVRVHYDSSRPARLSALIPGPNRATDTDGIRAIWGGPDHVTLSAPKGVDVEGRAHQLQHETGGAVVDQSHGTSIVNLSGPKARDVLSKGTGVDLHPAVFLENHVAHTSLFHHSVTIDRRAGPSNYDIHVPRGFAQDLHEHLSAHAAEHGYRLV